MVNSVTLQPESNERPSRFSERLGLQYASNVSQEYKKENGQFFTPIEVAEFMASYANFQGEEVRILDPGFGLGALSCALIEHLVASSRKLRSIKLVGYEKEQETVPIVNTVMTYLENWGQKHGIIIDTRLYNEDFVMANPDCLKPSKDLFSQQGSLFDIVIANPPYFKLSIKDKRVSIAKPIINGHPNIYTIFMAVAAKLLKTNGELILITPRSYASGGYFTKFRQYFFNLIELENVHLFTSRKDTFSRDKVLQETVIIKGIKKVNRDPDRAVNISFSAGMNHLRASESITLSQNEVVNLDSKEKVFYLPTSHREKEVLRLFRNWQGRLSQYNIEISTGPVVAFRARNFIQEEADDFPANQASLIWLHNVKSMILEWPIQRPSKGQYITINQATKSLLLLNKNYVLLRRFSSKEDPRRLVAAPYFCNFVDSTFLGVENKVNYIYRPNGHLLRNEVVGLSALLNSRLFDDYFRILNGNVNVSATEIRDMPLPPLETIQEIGDHIIATNDYTVDKIDEVVNEHLEPVCQMHL